MLTINDQIETIAALLESAESDAYEVHVQREFAPGATTFSHEMLTTFEAWGIPTARRVEVAAATNGNGINVTFYENPGSRYTVYMEETYA